MERPSKQHDKDDDDGSHSSSSYDDDDDDDDDSNSVDAEQEESSNDNDDNAESESNDSEGSDSDIQQNATIPLGQRIQQQSTIASDTKAAAATHAARQRKRAAKQQVKQRLAALRAIKIDKKKNADGDDDKKRKTSKHRPTEASSKRYDFYKNLTSLNERGIGVDLGAHKYKPRDPRLEPTTDKNLHGSKTNDDEMQFYQQLQKDEMKRLQSRIKAWKTTGKAGKRKRKALGLTANTSAADLSEALALDQARYHQLKDQLAAQERATVQAAATSLVQQHQRDLSKRAGKAVYLKRRQVKELTQAARLEQVKQRYGDKAVEKIVTKRRKREKSRDAKRLKKHEPLPSR